METSCWGSGRGAYRLHLPRSRFEGSPNVAGACGIHPLDFRLNESCQSAYILQIADFRRGESYLKSLLDRDNQSDVLQALPSFDVGGGELRPRDDIIIVKHLMQNVG